MATSYTPLLGLALPVTGDLAGQWGNVVNLSITELVDSAVAGTTTLSTDADVTLTLTDGSANEARQQILLWTAAGTTTRYITAPAKSKTYTVINASSTQSIVLRGAGPTTGVTFAAGETAVAAWDGSDFIKIAGGGAEAGGVIQVNKDVATVSYTLPSGSNGFSVGPITIAEGVEITVTTGQSWVVI